MTAKPRAPAPAVLTHRDRLPAGFAEVADLLGNGPLLALLEAHGGTRLYVPERVALDGKLAGLLGAEAARRLVARYGRDTLRVPLCKPWAAALLHGQGLTHADIARRLRINEVNVQRMLSGTARGARRPSERADTPQLLLRFGD